MIFVLGLSGSFLRGSWKGKVVTTLHYLVELHLGKTTRNVCGAEASFEADCSVCCLPLLDY